MTRTIDPVTFEVIKNGLDSIAEEMALVIMRSAHSAICRDSLDYSTAICDGQGRMVAQGLLTALHLGSFPFAMKTIIEHYRDNMQPGDIFATNDPYGGGGMHLPDIYVTKPIFYEGSVVGYATTLVHHTDIGGITPGGTAVHATEIFQEGLRIPLLKLHDAGRPNDTILKIIEKNVRIPKKVLGDLRAQVAACHAGEKAFLDLLGRHEVSTLHDYLDEMHNYAELVMRAEIESLPDGCYTFTDFIDGLGKDPEAIALKVKITIEGNGITVDWTGTSPQVKGAINAPGPFIYSATYLALRCLVQTAIPNAEGYMRPIKVIAPPGSIVNPDFPAAANARGITGFRAMDTVFGALAKAVPNRIPAAGEGGATNPSIGGIYNGELFVFTETILGAWGGRPDRDGIDGLANLAANQSNQPIEVIESENPIEVVHYGFVKDSGGPGTYRGGMAITREWLLLADEAVFTIRSDRRYHQPYGVAGGRTGTPSFNILNPGSNQKVLPVLPLESTNLRKGDSVRHIQPGAGGYGDPLERNPELVLEDVLDDKFGIDYVRKEYGVVINPKDMTVDEVSTSRLRKRLPTTGKRGHESSKHIKNYVRSLGLRLAEIGSPKKQH
jgi:N-methylhydantoinase B